MARASKSDELSAILSPLAMDTITYLASIGVALTMDQTIAFLTHFKEKAAELTAGGQEARNGQPA